MAYNKTFWKDEPSTETPISAENLNKIEQGIYNAHESIDKLPDWIYSGDKPSFDGYTKAETDALLDKKANAIINNASGETVVTTDSANATPSIKLFGKSEQVTYTGTQLFDVHSYSSTTRFSVEGEYLVLDVDNSSGTSTAYALYEYLPVSYLKPSITYKLVAEVVEFNLAENGSFYVSGNDTNNNKLSQFTNAIKITSTGTMVENLFARNDFSTSNYFVRGSVAIPSGTVAKVKVRISIIEDTTVTANTFVYEPYVGREASPSLNYPQDVVPHGASGSIEQKILTSNFLQIPDKTSTHSGITLVTENGVVKASGTCTHASQTNLTLNGSYNGTTTILTLYKGTYFLKEVAIRVFDGVNHKNYFPNQTIVVEDIVNITWIATPTYNNGQVVNETLYPRIVLQEDTPFEPYSEQVLIHQTPNGLGGIPLGTTIPDVIKNSPIHMSGVYWDNATSQYYIGNTKNENGKDVQRIGRKVFDGTEVIGLNTVTQGNLFRYTNTTNGIKNVIYNYLCNAYIGVYAGSRTQGTVSNSQNGFIDFVDNNFADLNTFKAKLKELYDAGTPVYVDYILAEPIITDLTEEELAQYNAIHMNYPNTTIVNSDSAYTEVEYVADTKCYIDKKFKELEVALANTNAQLL